MKLYILVRGDLSPGQQLAQVAHVAIRTTALRRLVEWVSTSNNLVVLQVPSEGDLIGWKETAESYGMDPVAFHEPDLDGQMTALAVPPWPTWMPWGLADASVLFAGLPLAGRNLDSDETNPSSDEEIRAIVDRPYDPDRLTSSLERPRPW